MATARVFASPFARKLAREAGIGVEDLTGTGPNGRIIGRDVEAAVSNRAARVTSSFCLRGTARAGKLVKLTRRVNEDEPDFISIDDLVLKAAARAHHLVPAFTGPGISVAIPSGGGLVIPALDDAHEMTVSALAATVRALTERAARGALRLDEARAGALTVMNLGAHGTEEFTATLDPPAAVLAVGAVHREPVITERGALKPARVLRVTLTADLADGAAAAAWLRTFLTLLEYPARILR